MHTIVVGATKGGVGKSTLAAALGVAAVAAGYRVVILDVDDQGSLVDWYHTRKACGGATEPRVLELERHIDVAVERAAEEGIDFLIIDTPPGSLRETMQAIELANFVLIPVRPSPIDTLAIKAMAEACEKAGVIFCFVLNATKPRSVMTQGAREMLKPLGPVLDIEIADRQVYASAMLTGATALEKEPNGPAAQEIALLWQEIEKRVPGRARAKRRA
jgi:chromosome partitioning protein